MYFFWQTPQAPGAKNDTRKKAEKEKDFLFKEIVSDSSQPIFVEKGPEEWRRFPIKDQDGSGTCVGQSMSKILGILRYLEDGHYIDFSATDIYQRRMNKNWGDGRGMIGVDAFNIVKKHGCTLELLMPSQKMSEQKVEDVKRKDYYEKVGKVIGGIGNYVMYDPKRDFDKIVGTIQLTQKPVMVWFMFDYNEWTGVPRLRENSKLSVHHSVTAVDACLYKGKEALIIEDSWGRRYGLDGRRVITREFFEDRNTFAAYPINLKNVEVETRNRPKYRFSKNSLKLHDNNLHVRELQRILRHEGLFPANIDLTGYYGSITARGVLQWQKKHNVAKTKELDELQGRLVGPKTLKKLNEIYS